MTKTFNQDPYYDDFNADKNFYKILFKPGVSVQARELTQLQSITQEQIRQFGNHVFKHGSVVIPGNSFAELETHYVKLQITPSTPLDITTLLEKDIIGATTGIVATIRKVVEETGTDPLTIYVGYKRGDGTGEFSVFQDGEELTVVGLNAVVLKTVEDECSGFGSLAYINKGTFYVNGVFVNVAKQSTVISKYSSTPSCQVLLKIVETIVDYEEDETLLDPAQGTYNYAAPGADRHKIELVLTSIPYVPENPNLPPSGVPLSEDYIEIMRYNAGVLEEHARYPQYNELAKSLARRTYDESGDYVVDNLTVTAREHNRTEFNNGVYPTIPDSPEVPAGDSSKFIVEIAPGKAYIRGFENELLASRRLVLDKGRTEDHIKTRNLVSTFPDYSQFVHVTDVRGFPEIKPYGLIELRLSNNTIIGSCRCIGVDLVSGDIYKFYITDVALNTNRTLDEVSKVTYNGGSAKFLHKVSLNQTSGLDFVIGDVLTVDGSDRTATVHKYARSSKVAFLFLHAPFKLPELSANCVSGTKFGEINGVASIESAKTNSTIFPLGFAAAAGVLNVEYKANLRQTVTLDSNGNGSITVAGMIIDSYEAGSFFASSASLGVIDLSGKVTVYPTSIVFAGVTESDGTTPIVGDVSVVFTATKSGVNAQPKTKILRTTTAVTSDAIGWALGHSDVLDVISVTANSADVTDKFTLDNGISDYGYFRAKIVLNPEETLTGSATVQYRYFEHSASGDYFSADSYTDSGIEYENIPKFKSKIDGTLYDLKNCLDFRSYINSAVAGLPTINQYVDFPPNGTRITASVRFYVPRIDLIVINKSGLVQNVTGAAAELPISPTQPSETLLLAKIFVPEYTTSIVDVIVENINNKRYTMKDINDIDNRVFRLNQYTLMLANNLNNLDNRVVSAVNTINKRIDDTEVRATALEQQNRTQDERLAEAERLIKEQERALAQLAYDTAVGQAEQDAALAALNLAVAAEIAATNAKIAATALRITAEQNAARALLEYTTNARITTEVNQLGFVIGAVSQDVQRLDARVTREGGAIRDRFARIEQFITSGAADQDSTNVGYLIEKFDNPDAIADIASPYFAASYYEGCLMPAISTNEIPLELVTPSGSSYTVSSPDKFKILHLPYYTTVFAAQRLSSRVTNVNPFAVYSWLGKMNLIPSSDTWVEVEYLPAIIKSSNETVNTTSSIRRPWDWAPDDGTVNPNAVNFAGIPNIIGCFTGETLVDMADGSKKRIDEIRVGDRVMNWNGTSANTVVFLEVPDQELVELYSPDTEHAPFATTNHPLFIAGKLSVVGGKSDYVWLGEMSDLVPAATTSKDVPVYNLWLDGDHTYCVNGYGTHSIIGDGGWLTDRFADNSLSDVRVMEIFKDCSENANKQLGAIIVNNFLSRINVGWLNTVLARCVQHRNSLPEQVLFELFKHIGTFARKQIK